MNEETFIACLTPPGRGAIATLAIRGPRAWTLVRDLFQPLSGKLPGEPEPGRFRLGRLAGAEVVLAVRGSAIELHCHGGMEIVRMLLDVFAQRGVQVCTWQEWENSNPLRNLARAALVQAATVRTAAILLDQYHGAFSKAVEAILANLGKNAIPEGLRQLDELAGRIPLGRHLLQPWRVVIAGASNVGKSSLVNALAGFQRSVVASTPGTTLDVVTTLVAIDGWPVELADTAGWRQQADNLEVEGIARAQTAAASADLCLWLLDGSTKPIYPESAARNIRLVINKVDLPAAWNWNETDAVRVSAKTNAGLDELCKILSGWLMPAPPPPGAAVPFNHELCDQMEEVRQLCAQGNISHAMEILNVIMN
jgi:tRNA modification GTPase